jgi:hypothetical protein
MYTELRSENVKGRDVLKMEVNHENERAVGWIRLILDKSVSIVGWVRNAVFTPWPFSDLFCILLIRDKGACKHGTESFISVKKG